AALERSVPLHRAPETAAATLRVAASAGVQRARLQLRPAELGGIEVSLRATAAGLEARVIAESPEALRVLQEAAGELRRSLEGSGMTLLSLEVAIAGDRPGADAGRTGRDGTADGPAAARRPGPDLTDLDASGASGTALALPGGVLVDVLA
ncbi:MAG: flagellar hook-length control protein FliK, partial [Actinomycetes bacterium]